MKPIKEGKVREIYDNGDSLIMVATDRISCFDVILNNTITKKGTVLTQMSKFWFDMTADILPNHMISADVKDMPEFFHQPQFDGNSKTAPYAAFVFRKVSKSPISFRSQSTHRPPKLRSVSTMRTSPTNKALLTWRNISRAKAKNMPQNFGTIPSLFIKSALTTL